MYEVPPLPACKFASIKSSSVILSHEGFFLGQRDIWQRCDAVLPYTAVPYVFRGKHARKTRNNKCFAQFNIMLNVFIFFQSTGN